MGWVLVTGSVAADIGKGTCAAVLARQWARSTGPVDYRKVEPCLQGALRGIDNTHFGDVIEAREGIAYDADVGRAAFLVPGFEPDAQSDTSLAELLAVALEQCSPDTPALRLVPTLAAALPWPAAARRVVEVGGTAGEPEHDLIVQTLLHALGPPSAHLHVSCTVTLPDGRVSTKASQVGLAACPHPPDVVFVRGGPAAPLVASCPVPVVAVADEAWPVAAWRAALDQIGGPLRARLGLDDAPDPRTRKQEGPPVDVALVTDAAGEAGYTMLRERLLGWSGGRVRFVPPGTPGAAVVRIGERPPPGVAGGAALDIVPVERGAAPRDPMARPDWAGTLDEPAGEVAAMLEALGVDVGCAEADADVPPLAYTDPTWSTEYLARSNGGALRDHALLDALMLRALPGPEGLIGKRLVDLGCGDGRFARMLVERGAEVVGIEVSPPMAAAARDRGLPNFTLLEGSVEDVALPGTFDHAVAPCSFDHVVDLDAALENVASVLRPGGRLILSTEHPIRTATRPGARWTEDRAARVRDYDRRGARAFHWFGRPEPVMVQHRTVGDWVQALERAGLRLRHVEEPAAADDGGVPRFWLLVAEKPGRVAPRITIDGPAGAGKSTLAQSVATSLGSTVYDSGARARHHAALAHDVADPSVVVACRAPRIASAVADELEQAMRQPVVLVGRRLGRTVDAGLRVWLDAPLEVRAARRGVPARSLEARDAADRKWGLLLEPDLLALTLDGTGPVEELVEMVVRAWRARRGARTAWGPCS